MAWAMSSGVPNRFRGKDFIFSNKSSSVTLAVRIRGVSVGGGRVRIIKLNNIDVDFTGEYCTVIIGHKDVTGTVAYITNCLAQDKVNVATLKLFREEKDKNAFTVIETDSFVSEELKEKILQYETINSVDLIEV